MRRLGRRLGQHLARRGRQLGAALIKERSVQPVLQLLARRAEVMEAVAGVGLVVTGVAQFNLGAAMIVGGLSLLTPIAWPAVRRKR